MLLFLAALGAGAPAVARGLDYADLRKIVTVSEPAISPDGSRIVYVRSRVDWEHDLRDTELVLIDLRSGSSRILTRDRTGVSDPQWSPDGSAISYIASPERMKAQLYVMRMDGGDSLRLTSAANGVSAFAWRGDSRALVYVAQNVNPRERDVERHHDFVVVDDEENYLTQTTPQPSHLWLINADGTANTRLTDGAWSVQPGVQPAFSPDGTRIYYDRVPDAIFAHLVDQTTYVHDIAAKTDTPLFPGVSTDPQLSRDGRAIAVAVPRHEYVYLTMDISVRSSADGRELWNSRILDRNVHAFWWLPNDSGLLVETADGIRSVAWIVEPNRPARRLDLGAVDIVSASIANDGGIAFVGERSDHYPEIYYLAPNATAPRRMTDDNAWAESYDLGKAEAFTWPTDLGVNAVGVLIYPVGYISGKRYPLVLDIHGGPVGTSTWDLAGLEEGGLDQLLAARGYFVFRPNYRGSDNQGDAFLQAIVGDMASGPGRDNLAAVTALRATGMIDPSRIFVSGWSGGGLQTSWLIGHASFWRAAVSGAAVNDQYQQAVLSDINLPFNQAFFNGVLPFTAQGRAAYAAESPITYVSAMRTPLLILSDTRDQRVPVPQAYELYHALKDRGVPVRFTVFPRAGHFPTDPVGQELVLRAWVGWIEQWSQ